MREERECPYCAEMILTRAKVCKHCGRDVGAESVVPSFVPAEPSPPRQIERTRSRPRESVGIRSKTDPVFAVVVLLVFVVVAMDVLAPTGDLRALRAQIAKSESPKAEESSTSPASNTDAQKARVQAQYDSLLDSLSKPSRENANVAASQDTGVRIMGTKVNIPDALPDIELSKKGATNSDFVDKHDDRRERHDTTPVREAEGSPPMPYPAALKAAGVEGEVLVSFEVTTAGRADMSTLKILRSTHPMLDAAVTASLRDMRFVPAEVDGEPVRRQVQRTYSFHINK